MRGLEVFAMQADFGLFRFKWLIAAVKIVAARKIDNGLYGGAALDAPGLFSTLPFFLFLMFSVIIIAFWPGLSLALLG